MELPTQSLLSLSPS